MVTRVIRALLIATLLSLFSVGAVAQGIIDWHGHPATLLGKLENGELRGVSHFVVLGYNPDIDAGTEDVWMLGGTISFATAAEQIYISSTNAADTMNLYIEGLNGAGVEISETKQLAGLTFTATANTYLRVHRVTAMGATAPVGNIYVHIDSVDGDANGIPDGGASDNRAHILAGWSVSMNGFYTCPASKTCYVIGPSGAGQVTTTISPARLQKRTGPTAPWVEIWTAAPGAILLEGNDFAHKFTALQDIKFRATSATANMVFTTSALVLIYD